MGEGRVSAELPGVELLVAAERIVNISMKFWVDESIDAEVLCNIDGIGAQRR